MTAGFVSLAACVLWALTVLSAKDVQFVAFEDQVCAARCVHVIVQYSHGPNVPPLNRFIEELHVKSAGTFLPASCADVEASLRRHSVDWRTMRIPARQLSAIPLPFIAHVGVRPVRIGHYQVILKVDSESVELWDGVRGIISQSRTEFENDFSGYVLADASMLNKQNFQSGWRTVACVLVAIFFLVVAVSSFFRTFYERRWFCRLRKTRTCF